MKPAFDLKRMAMTSLLALLAPLAAQAQFMPPPPERCPMADHPGVGTGHPLPGMPADPLPPHLRRLDLGDAQWDAIFDIFHNQARYIRERMKVIAQSDEGLRAMALSPTYDEARARDLAESGAVAQAQLKLLRLHTERQILSLLTPEQRRQAAELKTRMDARAMPAGPMPSRAESRPGPSGAPAYPQPGPRPD